MKTAAVWVPFALFAIVIAGAIHTVFQKKWVFLRKLDDSTRHAYTVLTVAAVVLLAWAKLPDLHIEALEIAGVKASVKKVETQSADTF
jgi:hypothetical protein